LIQNAMAQDFSWTRQILQYDDTIDGEGAAAFGWDSSRA
jgi:hypothetical protein